MSDLNSFLDAATDAIQKFPENSLLQKLRDRQGTVGHYVALLQQLFHQTREGSSSFAIAGARCPHSRWEVREYLFGHADEEKTHWRWIMDDLRDLKSLPADLERSYPNPATAAYIAFNFRAAETMPVSRLAIATVLEGIAAEHGPKFGGMLVRELGVKPSQMTFISSHAVTDAKHSVELVDVFRKLDLSPEEWAHAAFSARTAGYLYGEIFNSIARDYVA